jgi:hypothetical protein
VYKPSAELEGVPTPQIRNRVLHIVIRVGEAAGTVWPLPDISKGANGDIRQPARIRDARVEGVTLAAGKPTTIGEGIAVADTLIEVDDIPAIPGFVHQAEPNELILEISEQHP